MSHPRRSVTQDILIVLGIALITNISATVIAAILLVPLHALAAGTIDGFDACRQRFHNDPNKTVIVGDSIGVGIALALGVTCPSNRCTAVVGTTIEAARSQLPGVQSSQIIVSLGTNNWGEQNQSALDQKIRTFITAAGGKKIVAWVGPSQTSRNPRVESGLSRINPWIQDAITKAGTNFVNIRDPRNAGLNQHHDTVAGEGYHFDSTGYQILAATILNYAGICGIPPLSPISPIAPARPSSDTATPRPSVGVFTPQTSGSGLVTQLNGGQNYQGAILNGAFAYSPSVTTHVDPGSSGNIANADTFSSRSIANQAAGFSPASVPGSASTRSSQTTLSVTVVFFSGLCNSPDACRANEQARASITPKLPPGATLITPKLTAGAFPDEASAKALVSSLADNKIILIAYSAGNKGFLQTVNAMTPEQLKQVRTIVSLEAEYSGFEIGVRRVRSVNPQVEVYRFTSEQFQTNHSRLPGAAGVGDAIRTYSQKALKDSAQEPRTTTNALPQNGTPPNQPPSTENPATRVPSQYIPLFPGTSQTAPTSFFTPALTQNITQSQPPQSLLKRANDLFSNDAMRSAPPLTGNTFQPASNAALNAIGGMSAQPISPSISVAPRMNAEYPSPPANATTLSTSERSPASVTESTFQNPLSYSPGNPDNARINGDGENTPASFSRLREILNRLRTILDAFRL
ncbi:SGNH/GDSL hydrolase family protein [Methylocystis hirsuta]|uniref:SGNH/GDSL hydrolase family protein n=1 Tax=Methylocystis hirsuta TaxID=369798 RepID=UPI0011CDD761|nr:SGNH/GDSL hydrolase family protein [Methylocystis hirsuta]